MISICLVRDWYKKKRTKIGLILILDEVHLLFFDFFITIKQITRNEILIPPLQVEVSLAVLS